MNWRTVLGTKSISKPLTQKPHNTQYSVKDTETGNSAYCAYSALDTSKSKTGNDKPADTKSLLGYFCDLARNVGIDNEIALTDTEVLAELDSQGREDLISATPETRIAWAAAIGLRLVQTQGIVPRDWRHVITCAQCGPVYHYAAIGDLESCGWCHMRHAGKWFPQPETPE
jgi:hypothetical protein